MNNRHDKIWNDIRRSLRRTFVRDSGRVDVIARFASDPEHMLSMLDRALGKASTTKARATRSMKRRHAALSNAHLAIMFAFLGGAKSEDT